VVTNHDLVDVYGMDTSDEWIVRRTGVSERRFAEPGVATSDLAVEAARQAVEAAGIAPRDLDLIVASTLSPDKAFPGIGVYVQRGLGLPDEEANRFTPAIDVRAQCSGFLYGLSHAKAVLEAGMARHVLVVGAEVHSAALDLTTRGRTVASLFGDGAGAVVVAADPDPDVGIRTLLLRADGRYADELSQPVWNMADRPFIPLDDEGYGRIPPEQLYAQMNGQLVFKHAVIRMSEVLHEVVAAEGLTFADVDLFCFHQANKRINQFLANQLDLPADRVVSNIERYGNTTAATIPLLLDEAVRSGRLTPGMTVALVAFGSGFTWGGAIVRW
jgi:3-oxoacyl-[acyl-carrier-protein] synthase-3